MLAFTERFRRTSAEWRLERLKWATRLWRNRRQDKHQLVLLTMGTRSNEWEAYELAHRAGIFSWKIWEILGDLRSAGLIVQSELDGHLVYSPTHKGWERIGTAR